MQDIPNPNQNSTESSPKIELSLGKMQEKCLKYFNELSAEDKEALDYELNLEGAASIDNFHINLENEENTEKLNTFLALLARYKLCKTISGEDAKQEAKKALRDIAKLF